MTAVAVAALVCATALAALVLVLRFFGVRDAAASVSVTQTTEAELRELIKSAEMRLSKLEMQRVMR